MRLNQQFRRLVFAQVLLGIMAFCIAEPNPGLLLVAGAVALLSWYVTEGPRARSLPRWAINVGSLAAVAWLAVDLLYSVDHNVVVAMGHFTIWLQILLLYTDKSNREYGQLLVLSLLTMIGASILSISMLYGLMLGAYCALGLVTLLHFHFKATWDQVTKATRAAAPPQANVVPPKPMVGRGHRWHFRFLAICIGFVAAAVAVAVFVATPRRAQGPIGQPQNSPLQKKQAGFSQSVHLGSAPGSADNKQPVLNMVVRLDHEDVGGDNISWRLRGAALDSYNEHTHTWTRSYAVGALDQLHILPPQGWSPVALKPDAPRYTAKVTLRQAGLRVLFSVMPMSFLSSANFDSVMFNPMDQQVSLPDGAAGAVMYTIRWPLQADEADVPDYKLPDYLTDDHAADDKAAGGGAERRERRNANWAKTNSTKTASTKARPAKARLANATPAKAKDAKAAAGEHPRAHRSQAPADRDRAADRNRRHDRTQRDERGTMRWYHHRHRRTREALEDYARGWPSPGQEKRLRQYALKILKENGLTRDPTAATDPHDARIATVLSHYLRDHYQYTLDNPPTPKGTDPLMEFLFKRRSGHCELFASALAALTRSIGMQSRVVTGYLASEYNHLGGYYIVRQDDAHAWTEIYCGPGKGWRTFDSTPPAAVRAEHAVHRTWLTSVRELYELVEYQWIKSVVAYDQKTHDAVMKNIESSIGTSGNKGSWLGQIVDSIRHMRDIWNIDRVNYTLAFIIVLLIAAGVASLVRTMVIRRRRLVALQLTALPRAKRRGLAHRLRFYLSMLAMLERHGYVRPEWQSPFSFAQELAEANPMRFDPVIVLTEIFYEIRFGHRQVDQQRKQRIKVHLKHLEQALSSR